MIYSMGFGKTRIEFNVNEGNILGELRPNEVEVHSTGEMEIKRALDNPINSPKLSGIVKPGEKIVIVTSDITRPMPSRIVLPYVIDEILKAGCSKEDITIVFALGAHRSHTDEEKRYIVGEEIFNTIKCMDSNQDDYIHLGNTKNGTPIDIFTPVATADKRICLGNIEYHYFAGYSGGVKAIMPGVSTRHAIQANHSIMIDDGAVAGNIDTNPVRLDLESIGEVISIDFIVNVVLDENKKIVKAVAGHFIDAHREGCRFLDELYKIPIKEKADIVIVSQGGYPKDLNLYQAQKALDNAKHAVKDGGIIILVASCKEGLGEAVFESWMTGAKTSKELIKKIGENFVLGGHKAAAIALTLEKAKIFLVSELEAEFIKTIFMKPFNNIQDALEQALIEKGLNAKIILMPIGGSTLPVYDKEL
ncbi:nickel-dependent lactate racemase [Paratissierella segnis]|uniref:Nickel-dependent lactate racemase n=1 Tax=Paratissierella segnis TaxID=2763679 RepID=A0A926EVY4_9FIRM|nr:nickel-dependent lactate racemase [Paratissierella segnis]MBC8587230.1 nickel-dependent lactate racemase [Paratissierella segnis]